MPISAPGNKARQRRSSTGGAAGFTLLEVLVVLVIGGLLVALASLSLTRNPRTDLIDQAQRLALSFETASDEAQVRATPVAWEPLQGGYQFAVRTGDGWRPMRDALLGAVRWQVPVSSVEISYPAARGDVRHTSTLVFGTESVGQPVTVTLVADAGSIRVVSDGSGRFEVVGGP